MQLVTNGIDKYIKITDKSIFTETPSTYDRYAYPVEMDGEFNDNFLSSFIIAFKNIKDLGFSNEIAGELTFLYSLKHLEKLTIYFYSDVKALIDFSKMPPLSNLGMNWYFKYIKNLETQKELRHLSISDFTEKDFKRIPQFDKLKSFMSVGGKLKTLDNIEAIKNIEALEISAHRSLSDITAISSLKKLKFIEINSCWKMADFSPLAELKELEVVKIIDCKNLESIKFVKELPKLRQLYAMGSTTINDFDTTPAEDIPYFFGSQNTSKYNKQYPEKEIIEGQKGWKYYAGE